MSLVLLSFAALSAAAGLLFSDSHRPVGGVALSPSKLLPRVAWKVEPAAQTYHGFRSVLLLLPDKDAAPAKHVRSCWIHVHGVASDMANVLIQGENVVPLGLLRAGLARTLHIDALGRCCMACMGSKRVGVRRAAHDRGVADLHRCSLRHS
jgi:hypothetical protein